MTDRELRRNARWAANPTYRRADEELSATMGERPHTSSPENYIINNGEQPCTTEQPSKS